MPPPPLQPGDMVHGGAPRHRYTQDQIIRVLAASENLTVTQSRNALLALGGMIRLMLKRGRQLTIFQFGHFRRVQRARRAGRNPRTGAAIFIQAKYMVKFRVHEYLRSRL